jgi:hypothetical protein
MSVHIGQLESSFEVQPEPDREAPPAAPSEHERDIAAKLVELERRLQLDRLRTYARGYAD